MRRLMLVRADVEGNDPTDIDSIREVGAVLPEESGLPPLGLSSITLDAGFTTLNLPFWAGLAALYGVAAAGVLVAALASRLLFRNHAQIAPEAGAAASSTTPATSATPASSTPPAPPAAR
jgi:hypothetical protein